MQSEQLNRKGGDREGINRSKGREGKLRKYKEGKEENMGNEENKAKLIIGTGERKVLRKEVTGRNGRGGKLRKK